MVPVGVRWSYVSSCCPLVSAVEWCCGGGVPGVVFEVGCSLPVASLGDSGVFGSVGVLA